MPGAELLDGGGVDCGILSAVLFFAPYRLPKFFLNTRRFKSKKGEQVKCLLERLLFMEHR